MVSWIIKRFRVVISISLILSSVVTYLIAYLPMTKELEKTTLQSFIITAQANERTVTQFIQNCKDGAAALSSRTMMKDLISEYRNGQINSLGLKSSSQAYFMDGVRVLQNVKGAFRFTDGVQIASYGSGDTSKLVSSGGVKELYYELDAEKFLMIVYSPIINNGENLGCDVIFFDLNKTINALNKEYTLFSIIDAETTESLEKGKARKVYVNNIRLLDDGKFITYTNGIEGTDKSFYVKIQKDELFKSVHKISVINLIEVLFCNIALMLITNFTIIRFVMYKLSQAEKTKEIYKEYAYRDTLTGAYSRLYFEKWSKAKIESARFVHEDISVVMIDINRYKYINDTYGHAAGDKALQRVAAILQMSFKSEDLVVRYGGDEFLLILTNCKYEEADRVLAKVNNNMMKIEDLDFGLSISYGIEQIGSYKELHGAVQRADEKMYESKNAYKALLWF